jgi:hypothetical protein
VDCDEKEMKQSIKRIFVLAVLSVLLVHATTAEDNPAQRRLDSIALAITKGTVGTIVILQMPANIETRASVSPDNLEKWFYNKLTIRNITESAYRDKVISAFKSLSAVPQQNHGDIRWGVIFYSRDEQRIGAVFFDRSGKNGNVDHLPVSFHGDFFAWLDRTFSACFQ